MVNDTITALITPEGQGGISVIRLSGPEAVGVAGRFIHPSQKVKRSQARYVQYGSFHDSEGFVDEVLFTVYQAPQSYTGEDVVEISLHGSPYIAQRMMEALLQEVRLANPGEFTLRRFLNQKMDLTQAEAVNDLIRAKTRTAHAQSVRQLQGGLSDYLRGFLEQLTHYRKQVEVEIDFSDQEEPDVNVEQLICELTHYRAQLMQFIATGRQGLVIRDGLKVILLGAPNVGKSSIFNAFLQTERAIVTPIPGTTRDYLEEAISLDGYLVRFFDTAGLRETEDHVETIGIQRTLELSADADLILVIQDDQGVVVELLPDVSPDKIIRVMNKCDLLSDSKQREWEARGFILSSTVREEGLDALKQVLLSRIHAFEVTEGTGVLTNTRQIAAVKKTLTGIDHAVQSLQEGAGFEFTAFDLREASQALEEILGKISSDDLLNQIFSGFCIGK